MDERWLFSMMLLLLSPMMVLQMLLLGMTTWNGDCSDCDGLYQQISETAYRDEADNHDAKICFGLYEQCN